MAGLVMTIPSFEVALALMWRGNWRGHQYRVFHLQHTMEIDAENWGMRECAQTPFIVVGMARSWNVGISFSESSVKPLGADVLRILRACWRATNQIGIGCAQACFAGRILSLGAAGFVSVWWASLFVCSKWSEACKLRDMEQTNVPMVCYFLCSKLKCLIFI